MAARRWRCLGFAIAASALRIPTAPRSRAAVCIEPRFEPRTRRRATPSEVRDGSDDREGFRPAVVDTAPPVAAAVGVAVGFVVLGSAAYDVVVEPGWSLLDACYFVAATVSTVGYGDLRVESDAAKLFTALYCLVGVAVVGLVFGEIVASALLEAEASVLWRDGFRDLGWENDEKSSPSCLLGDELDRDELVYIAGRADELTGGGTGAVDGRALALLVRQDKVRAADVRRVLETFDRLDADGSGVLDGDDLRGFFAETAAPELLEALQQRPAASSSRMSRSGVVRFDDLRRFDGFADVGDASLRRFISVGDRRRRGAARVRGDGGRHAARADVGDCELPRRVVDRGRRRGLGEVEERDDEADGEGRGRVRLGRPASPR
ncbi:ion channel [Aureococcus anophagefferens]|nr:ion channel [Aureococcus anophagefferens]